MAMKILKATRGNGAIVITVHLDTTKVASDGAPLSDYVATYQYSDDAIGETPAAKVYADIKKMIKVQAQEQLDRVNKAKAPVVESPIAMLEGQTL